MSIVTYNNRSIANISAIPGAAKSLTHIKTLTASSSSTLSFVDGSSDVVLDSTYPIYLFKFIGIHPSASQGEFQVGFRDGGSDYDATKTASFFYAYADEADTTADATVSYNAGKDIAQGTGFQIIADDMSNDNDGCGAGTLHLFDPSNTTFVKHFLTGFNVVNASDQILTTYSGGYANTTSAINAIDFKVNSGNIDSGTITMYGVL